MSTPSTPTPSTTPPYTKLRFIGYPICTSPTNIVSIWPGTLAGTYVADPNTEADITGRVTLLKYAVDSAQQLIEKAAPNDTGTINVFLAPEFYFHGALGPYVFCPPPTSTLFPAAADAAAPEAATLAHSSKLDVAPVDPVHVIQEQLTKTFPPEQYPNWMFIFGSAMTTEVANIANALYDEQTQVRNRVVEQLAKECLSSFGTMRALLINMLQSFIGTCHAFPVVVVRGRSPIQSNLGTKFGHVDTSKMTTEKYAMSTLDLVLYDPNGGAVNKVITEQMISYPPIDLSNGDLKRGPDDQYAIFRQYYMPPDFTSYLDFGVEICLDHLDYRLRKGIRQQPFPSLRDAIHVQLVPSNGAQILSGAVATDKDGYVFNCDGAGAIGSSNQYGTCQKGNKGNGAQMNCLYTDSSTGTGHTQLARVLTPAVGGNPSLGTDATFYGDLSPVSVQTAPVVIPPGSQLNVSQYFAATGPGEVHIYGLPAGFPFSGPINIGPPPPGPGE